MACRYRMYSVDGVKYVIRFTMTKCKLCTLTTEGTRNYHVLEQQSPESQETGSPVVPVVAIAVIIFQPISS